METPLTAMAKAFEETSTLFGTHKEAVLPPQQIRAKTTAWSASWRMVAREVLEQAAVVAANSCARELLAVIKLDFYFSWWLRLVNQR
jgi:hypothetical protein